MAEHHEYSAHEIESALNMYVWHGSREAQRAFAVLFGRRISRDTLHRWVKKWPEKITQLEELKRDAERRVAGNAGRAEEAAFQGELANLEREAAAALNMRDEAAHVAAQSRMVALQQQRDDAKRQEAAAVRCEENRRATEAAEAYDKQFIAALRGAIR
jgi:hypothetical protein